MSESIEITVNGERMQTENQIPIPRFLESQGIRPDRVVVEWNGTAKTRSEAAGVQLSDGDHLEVVRIVAGG